MATVSERGLRRFLRWLFRSPAEPRLRAGWRLLLQTLLLVIFVVGLSLLSLLIPGVLTGRFFGANPMVALGVSEVAELVAVTLSVWLARRFLDHRSFASLGLAVSSRTLIDLAIGFGISLVMMAFIFVAELSLGWLKVTGEAWAGASIRDVGLLALASLAIFVLVGWSEELLTRGYHLQTLASGTNIAAGLLISSAIFGALHLANPHASVIAAIGILVAGLLLGYAYVRTGQLWMSIGLHIGWNFFEGVVFGFPVSGLDVYRLVRTSVSGPELWTGGAFGPEAGLVLLPASVIGFILVLVLGRRTGADEASGRRHSV